MKQVIRKLVGYKNIVKIRKAKRQRQLNRFLTSYKTPQAFYDYTIQTEQNVHLIGNYFQETTERRSLFNALFDNLGLNLHERSFLDLGPAIGDSLDIAKERGATASFADYDPYVLAYNILKGFRAFNIDYIVEGMSSIPIRFDVILSRGSINADRFNRNEVGVLPFDKWLTEVEGLVKSGGVLVICPTFDKGEEPYYVPRNLDKFPMSIVGKTFREHGFTSRFIPGFNKPPEIFPFTFVWWKP